MVAKDSKAPMWIKVERRTLPSRFILRRSSTDCGGAGLVVGNGRQHIRNVLAWHFQYAIKHPLGVVSSSDPAGTVTSAVLKIITCTLDNRHNNNNNIPNLIETIHKLNSTQYIQQNCQQHTKRKKAQNPRASYINP